MAHSVEEIRKLLEGEGVRGVREYCKRLKAQRKNSSVYRDLLSEAYAALMFARSGFEVTMRDCPDLRLYCKGVVVGAEVKRFRRKEQDDIDERRMEEAQDFVTYGDTVPTEGKEAWRQVEDVAVRKCSQLWSELPNVLVIQSSSPNCIEDTEVLMAVNSLADRDTAGDSGDTGKLNGILFMSLEYNISQKRNVHFFEAHTASVPLPIEVRQALNAITEWKAG
jgi:hypothetical protein